MSEHIERRAKTLEEKQAIIERLYTMWVRYPHLRLGQLIANAFTPTGAMYFAEDTDFIHAIEEVQP